MTITEWLNSERNYSVGVALYAAYGTDALVKSTFDQGHSALRAQRLFNELLLLRNADAQYNVPDQAKAAKEAVFVAAAAMPEQAVSEHQDPLRNEWMPKYQEMNMLRHKLEQTGAIKDRGVMAFRILELEQECMAIWSRRDYRIKTGRDVPEVKEETDVFADNNNILRRIQTLRTYVTKYSKPSDKKNWPQRLAQYKAELEALGAQYKSPKP
jgi:hypothetical protein